MCFIVFTIDWLFILTRSHSQQAPNNQPQRAPRHAHRRSLLSICAAGRWAYKARMVRLRKVHNGGMGESHEWWKCTLLLIAVDICWWLSSLAELVVVDSSHRAFGCCWLSMLFVVVWYCGCCLCSCCSCCCSMLVIIFLLLAVLFMLLVFVDDVAYALLTDFLVWCFLACSQRCIHWFVAVDWIVVVLVFPVVLQKWRCNGSSFWKHAQTVAETCRNNVEHMLHKYCKLVRSCFQKYTFHHSSALSGVNQ